MFGCFSFRSKRNNRTDKPRMAVVAAACATTIATGIGYPSKRAEPAPVAPAPKSWSGTSAGLKEGDQVWIKVSSLYSSDSEKLGYSWNDKKNGTCALATYIRDEEQRDDGDAGRKIDVIFDINGTEVRITFYTCDL